MARRQTPNTREFIANPEFGKARASLNNELREIHSEIRRRTVHGLSTEDQSWRRRNLRDARARMN